MWKKIDIELNINKDIPTYVFTNTSKIDEKSSGKHDLSQIATIYPKLVKRIESYRKILKKYDEQLKDKINSEELLKKQISLLDSEKSEYLDKIKKIEEQPISNSLSNSLGVKDNSNIPTELNNDKFNELQQLLGAGLDFINQPKVYVDVREQILDEKGLPGAFYEKS